MSEDKKTEELPFEKEKGNEPAESPKAEKKKIKNLIAAVIVISGLFLGSVFVDVAQLFRGSGFSSKALSQMDIFSSGGKTWVAYSDPIIKVQVLTDDSCAACKPDEPLLWLRRIVPTILTVKVDNNSDAGKKLISDFNLKTVPAFVFSKEVEQTDFFKQAGSLFDQKNDQDVLRTADVGLPVGEYLSLPSIGDNDPKVGPSDAKVKIIQFSDFQCPYCKTLHTTVMDQILKDYNGKIEWVYKTLPLSIHPQAENASNAGLCANEQGKFLPYADKLFVSQADWGATTGTQKFKTYALQLGLNATQFNSCLDGKKYQSTIEADKTEANDFGISGTPATFINSNFKNGSVTLDDMKAAIDAELAK